MPGQHVVLILTPKEAGALEEAALACSLHNKAFLRGFVSDGHVALAASRAVLKLREARLVPVDHGAQMTITGHNTTIRPLLALQNCIATLEEQGETECSKDS